MESCSKVPDPNGTSSVQFRQESDIVVECGNDLVKSNDGTQRATWGGKIEFLLTCVGFAVGLGNVWRFPYLCFKNGGGAFLIPYFFMLFTVGLPFFFMELAFGQFASLGPVSIWSISPLFKGVGVSMVVINIILGSYYNVIIAQCVLYFFASLTSKLPWSTCGNWWNDPKTCVDKTFNHTVGAPGNHTVGVTTQYYNNYVLRKSEGIHDFGAPVWHLTLCLLFSWIVVLGALLKGVQSLGKVAYFTALFPYVILTILLIRSVLLPGSAEGIRFYLTPDFEKLKDPEVWSSAATQIFFSLSCCNGGLIAMASFNQFKNNCARDAVLVANLNCATSFYAGFVIFSNLGFMAHVKKTSVDKVVEGGTGLAFVVYPEALENMPVSPLWAVLFFLMMMTLGFGSEFSIVETVLSGFQDELKKLGFLKTGRHAIIYRVAVCTGMFFLGLPLVTRGGSYLLNIVDTTLSGYPLLVLALLESIILCYLYGIRQFMKDIEMMTGSQPNWYWKITWCCVSPAIILAMIIFLLINGMKDFKDGAYIFPAWTKSLSVLIIVFTLCFVPVFFLYRFCAEGGMMLFQELLKPKTRWGPAEDTNRQDFLDKLRVSGGSIELEFYQNKLNVAQKMALSETSKRGSSTNFNSLCSFTPSMSLPSLHNNSEVLRF